MEKIRGDVVVLTTWLSFIVAIWLWLFRIIGWHGPIIFLILVIVIALLSQSKT